MKKKTDKLEHYYEWGNEPIGYVTVGYYKNDIWVTDGMLLKKDAEKMGLTFLNPNA